MDSYTFFLVLSLCILIPICIYTEINKRRIQKKNKSSYDL